MSSDSIHRYASIDLPRLSVPIFVREDGGLHRKHEPVSIGIPFPKGAVSSCSELALLGPSGDLHPVQIQSLAHWCDGSIRWALLDFQADAGPNETIEYTVCRSAGMPTAPHPFPIHVKETNDFIEVTTGCHLFALNLRELKFFEVAEVDGIQVLDGANSTICLVDDKGTAYRPEIIEVDVETRGTLRTTIKFTGRMASASDPAFAYFVSRVSFFAGSGTVEVKFTVRNCRAAMHKGGYWDLGDPGSIHFKSLSIDVRLRELPTESLLWPEMSEAPPLFASNGHLEVYQDSSGGVHWDSANHVDRFGRIGSTFRGYRVTAGAFSMAQGLRATPTLCVHTNKGSVSAAIEQFWQNFPKAMEIEGELLRLGLFPHQFAAGYELQPGEQKTHIIRFSFDSREDLRWAHRRLTVAAAPAWYAEAGGIPYISPRDIANAPASVVAMEKLVDTAVSGSNTFFDRREVIDEYGWRHFGDIYADHEAVGHRGETPLIAHYNNQYDVIHGALLQYVRTADARWFQLATDLTQHVIDIDIYHTAADRAAYNGGLFWHTEHYTDAATCTHRAYSKARSDRKHSHQSGGGPSGEHNYTTGLMEYYFLTGDPAAKEAALGLADWVTSMDARSGGVLGAFDPRPRGLSSMTGSRNYHGPGRGCGNSINALLDAFVLTGQQKYWVKAEQLIRRSVHPHDDIEGKNLPDVEHRWSYTVFLQTLGKYLDLKTEYGQVDFMYSYARASLLHYARWMLVHEVPYRRVMHKVEIPTETWPAQDIRKSNVFYFAAKYSDDFEREKFLERAHFFFEHCISDLLEFTTCQLTRPVVLLMTNGYRHPQYLSKGLSPAPLPNREYEFGTPRSFKPQFSELFMLREQVYKAKKVISDVANRLKSALTKTVRD